MPQTLEHCPSLGAPARHRQSVSQLALDFRVPLARIECRPQSRDRLRMHALLQVCPGRIAPGLRKRRVQLERVPKLLDGVIVLPRVKIVPAQMDADHQSEEHTSELQS